MLPSYRNQSVDLESKSTDCFYMIGTLVVKGLNEFYYHSNVFRCYLQKCGQWKRNLVYRSRFTPQKMKFSIKDFFIFCAVFISRLFTSWALLFRFSLRGTMSYMVTVFFSDISDWAKSIIDHGIWLAALLLFSSFVPTCRWSGLNSQMVGLTWSHMQLTLALLSDIILVSFLFPSFLLRGNHLSF